MYVCICVYVYKINTFPIVSSNMDSIYDITLDLLSGYAFIFISCISHPNIYHIHFSLSILSLGCSELGNCLSATFSESLFFEFADIYLIHD